MISPSLTDCVNDTQECKLPRCDDDNPKHLAEYFAFTIKCIIKSLNETKATFLRINKIDIQEANSQITSLNRTKNNFIRLIDTYITNFLLEKESLSKNLNEQKSEINDVTDKMIQFYNTIKEKTTPNLLEEEKNNFAAINTALTTQYNILADEFERLKTQVQVSGGTTSATTQTAKPFVPAPTPAPAPAIHGSSTYAPAPGPATYAPAPGPAIHGSSTHSHAPAPGPAIHGSSTYAPAPGPGITSYSPGITSNVDHTSYGLLHQTLTHKLESVVGSELGVQVKPTFREELGKLVVFIKSIDYSSLTANKKLNLEKSVQKEVHDFLLLKFRNTGEPKFQVDLSRIKVETMSGSTYLVIQITPKTVKHSLSNTDKEMLEFYNFLSVLQRGQVPIRENDYLQHHYPFNR